MTAPNPGREPLWKTHLCPFMLFTYQPNPYDQVEPLLSFTFVHIASRLDEERSSLVSRTASHFARSRTVESKPPSPSFSTEGSTFSLLRKFLSFHLYPAARLGTMSSGLKRRVAVISKG